MVLTVYGHPLSQPSRSVYLFCKATKIPYTEKNVDMSKEEHKKEPYLSINPMGAVPSIVDDGFKLSECMTILKYLARKNKVADNWYPQDLKVQAKVNQYLDWHHTGIRKSGIDVFVGKILTPIFTGKPVDEAKLAKDLEAFDKALGTIEKVFLGDNQFLASDKISIADICCLSEMMQVVTIQQNDVLANYPKLAAWKERAIKQLKPAFDEVFKPLFEFTSEKKK
ncbi:glutathione S-transferase theta-1-like [Acanthaster planci]|uniref:Glutathione S-transferase theta-1-like n=1 Tax=Acanthaster planci TaxID=133434 RepID=A0A8B7Y0G7_ACAPL|nr:glutathione S-transferase theta-1-like [Acanthaster planci]